MDEIFKAAGAAGGGTLGVLITWQLVKTLWAAREKKRDLAEEKAEKAEQDAFTALSAKVDNLLAEMKVVGKEMQETRVEVRLMSERYLSVQTALSETRERVNGMSAAYSKSIDELKTKVTQIETKMDARGEVLNEVKQRLERIERET